MIENVFFLLYEVTYKWEKNIIMLEKHEYYSSVENGSVEHKRIRGRYNTMGVNTACPTSKYRAVDKSKFIRLQKI
jgi:hypothetical protein